MDSDTKNKDDRSVAISNELAGVIGKHEDVFVFTYVLDCRSGKATSSHGLGGPPGKGVVLPGGLMGVGAHIHSHVDGLLRQARMDAAGDPNGGRGPIQ